MLNFVKLRFASNSAPKRAIKNQNSQAAPSTLKQWIANVTCHYALLGKHVPLWWEIEHFSAAVSAQEHFGASICRSGNFFSHLRRCLNVTEHWFLVSKRTFITLVNNHAACSNPIMSRYILNLMIHKVWFCLVLHKWKLWGKEVNRTLLPLCHIFFKIKTWNVRLSLLYNAMTWHTYPLSLIHLKCTGTTFMFYI